MQTRSIARKLTGALTSVALLASTLVAPALAASLTSGSLAISDSRPSQTAVTYTHTFSNVTTSAIKCLKLVYATTATGTTVPTGMSTTGAALSGTSNFVPTPASWGVNATTNGTVLITLAAGETPASAAGRTVVLTGITNGSTVETGYFVQFSTYNNTDCTTSPVDNSTVMFVFANGQVVTATVDPTLTFTISPVSSGGAVNGATTNITTTDGTIPLGTLSTSSNKIAAHDLSVGTNAQNGYTVYVRYTGQLANAGSYNLTDHTGTNASPTTFTAAGTESFGYTTDALTQFTSAGGNKWAAFTTTNASVATAASPGSQSFRTGYQVGISPTTRAGAYTTTVIYTATPTY